MTAKEFMASHGITSRNTLNDLLLMSALDRLYLEFTREQAVAIVADYYDHADEIYNDQKKNIEENFKHLQELFGKEE